MKEKNQKLAENLEVFLLSFKADVIKGLQDCLNAGKPAYQVL